MMPKRCRVHPALTCIFGPCYFGGSCHLREEGKREAIRAGEAEYLSWFPPLTDGVMACDGEQQP